MYKNLVIEDMLGESCDGSPLMIPQISIMPSWLTQRQFATSMSTRHSSAKADTLGSSVYRTALPFFLLRTK